jgi:hypothetical protein
MPHDACQVMLRCGVLALFGPQAGEPGAHVQPVAVQVAVGAVGDAGLKVPVRLSKGPDFDGTRAEVGVGPCDVLMCIVGFGEVQALR